jgi:hypothetical protein
MIWLLRSAGQHGSSNKCVRFDSTDPAAELGTEQATAAATPYACQNCFAVAGRATSRQAGQLAGGVCMLHFILPNRLLQLTQLSMLLSVTLASPHLLVALRA